VLYHSPLKSICKILSGV